MCEISQDSRIEAVLAAIHERRSIRRFTAEPVSRDAVEAILDAGRWAPSGLNNQPWRFAVVWAGDPRQEGLAGCTKYAAMVREARVLIAVLLHRPTMYDTMKDHQSAGACIQNMLLAAHALGLGAVWLGQMTNQADKALEVLGLDLAEYAFMTVIAVGHPAGPGTSQRKSLAELVLGEF